MSDSATSPAGQRRPSIDVAAAVWASALVVVLVALAEVDRVIGGVIDPTRGRGYTPTGQTGPSVLSAVVSPTKLVEGWGFLADPNGVLAAGLAWWLIAYAAIDLIFIGLYGWALCCAARSSVVTSSLAKPLVIVGVGADVLETLLIGTLAGPWFSTSIGWLLVAVSALKWSALFIALFLMIRSTGPWRRATVWPQSRRVLRGLYTHRSSLLIVVPLVVMSLAHGHDILEQVPDIERRWIDGDHWHGVSAVALTIVLALGALIIGRLRTDDLVQRRLAADQPPGQADPPTAPEVSLRLWYASGFVILGLAVVAQLIGGDIRWYAVAVFCSVPLAIGVVSSVFRHCSWQGEPPPTDVPDAERVRTAWLIGDLLPWVLVAAFGASAVRSFTSYVMLNPSSLQAWVLLVLGAALAILAWPLYERLLDRLESAGRATDQPSAATPSCDSSGGPHHERGHRVDEPTDSDPEGRSAIQPSAASPEAKGAGHIAALARGRLQPGTPHSERRWVAPLVLVVGVGGYVGTGIVPELVGRLGVLAAFQLAVGSLGIAIAAAVSVNRRWGVPHVFWRLQRPVVPVTTLIVVTGMVGAVAGGPPVHPIRTLDAPTVTQRPDITTAFDDWYAATEGCDVEENGHRIRPLLLFAAEGGGIRAAYWTAAAVDHIALASGETGCGRAFLSTGASGGSVGLTIASVADSGEATEQVRSIAEPSALAQAAIGLISRDQLFAASGIGLPTFSHADEGWVDRAGLIELSWEESIDDFEQPFFDHRSMASPVGAMVLNSTASNGCRALVSQIEFDVPDDAAPGSCVAGSAPIAASIDLARCTGQLRTSTAALLTARFPYVTPAGETICKDGNEETEDPEVKFVDGGYGENTGIVTQIDLMTEWMPLVRRHNTDLGEGESIVVPVLVYFDNGSGSDLRAEPGGPPVEVLIPPLTKGAATSVLTSAESNLQRVAAMLATAELGIDGDAAEAVEAVRPRATAVVYAASRPTIAAPLGWVLSSTVMDEMDKAIASASIALPGHAALSDVRSLVTRASAKAT